MKTPEEMENMAILDISLIVHNDGEWFAAKKAWLAGYKAAMDEVADVSKVMPQWISVKERLPDYDQLVLIWHPDFNRPFVASRVDSALMSPLYWWRCELDMYESEEVIAHWMELPEPPKEEK